MLNCYFFRMSKKAKQMYFKDVWLTCPEFWHWSTVKTEARCKLCKTNIGLSNMSVKTLKSHSQSKDHQKRIKEKEQISNFFKKKANIGEQADRPEPEVMKVLSDDQGSSVTVIPRRWKTECRNTMVFKICSVWVQW